MVVTHFPQPKFNSDTRFYLFNELLETFTEWLPRYAFILASKEKEFTNVHVRILSYNFKEDHILTKYFFEEMNIHYPEIKILSQEDKFNLPKEADFISMLFKYLCSYPVLLSMIYMVKNGQISCQGYFNLLGYEKANQFSSIFDICFEKILNKIT